MIKPRRDEIAAGLARSDFFFRPSLPGIEYQDEHDNIVYRAVLQPGLTTIEHDALVAVSSHPDNHGISPRYVPLSKVPRSVLRYTLPSRYCDSDNIIEFAKDTFGKIPLGVDLVQAICDWVHTKIEYRTGSGLSNISASQILDRGYGVCRDFAHVAITLCRAFDLPTRYVTGHLPDIGRKRPRHADGLPRLLRSLPRRMDDLRRPVQCSSHRDASRSPTDWMPSTGPLPHFTGKLRSRTSKVWAYQVNPDEVSVGDPIDLSKRLDGTDKVRAA